MNEPIRTLISAAVLAPSGDNMQPWRFEIDEACSSITVCVDDTRDTSPMNAGQRMSRVACGAAIENIVQTAEHNRWNIAIEAHDDSLRVATLRFATDAMRPGNIPVAIRSRHTNRRIYNGSALPDGDAERWRDMIEREEDVDLIWVTNKEAKRELAVAVGRTDADMFRRAAFLKAFLENVRFDLPFCAAADEGLCLGSLELSGLERRMLPMLRNAPNAFLRSWPVRRSFQTKAERLMNSSSGTCLIVPKTAEAATSFRIGRIMQRAWLYLTEAGYQVQPMMSIPVLANADGDGCGESLSEVLGDSAICFFRSIAERLPAAILRFGRGPAASARTGRRPVPPVIQSHALHVDAMQIVTQSPQ